MGEYTYFQSSQLNSQVLKSCVEMQRKRLTHIIHEFKSNIANCQVVESNTTHHQHIQMHAQIIYECNVHVLYITEALGLSINLSSQVSNTIYV